MYKYRHLLLALLTTWMVVIFVFSSQASSSSTGQSNVVINSIRDITGLQLPELLVRKGAHFVSYFTLGTLATLTTLSYGLIRRKILAISILIVVLYAASDEIHQLAIPGRSGQISDVLLDSLAGIIAIGVTLLLVRKNRHTET